MKINFGNWNILGQIDVFSGISLVKVYNIGKWNDISEILFPRKCPFMSWTFHKVTRRGVSNARVRESNVLAIPSSSWVVSALTGGEDTQNLIAIIEFV